MNEKTESDSHQKAKYSNMAMENLGCCLVIIVGGICFTSASIMYMAFRSRSALEGALAVTALAAMGVGVTYFLVRTKDK